MSKLKILIEYTPTRCEICHQDDLFDKESCYCSRCAVIINEYSSQLNNTKSELVQNNIAIINSGTSLEIIIPYFSIEDVIGSGVFLLFSIIAIYNGMYFAIIIAFIFLYMLIINLINKRTIIVNNKELHISYKPIRSGWNQTIKSDDIIQIFCKKAKIIELYKVIALLRNGKEIELINDLNKSDQAFYIENQIEKFLCISDKYVSGEISKSEIK